MRITHFIGGLPRAGSTMTCNILNQNPHVYCSSTSPLPSAIAGLTLSWSQSAEVKGLLVRDRPRTLERITRTARAVSNAWYSHVEKPIVFDKSRAWNFHAPMIGSIWPDAKLITVVRDMRSIAGSVEKRHIETAMLDDAMTLDKKTMLERHNLLLGPQGPVGLALVGMEDLIRRHPANWHVIRYEDMCDEPYETFQKLYDILDEPNFDHDFSNIENVAEDVDEMYLLKFPHEGCGPMRKPKERDWEGWISDDLEALIFNRFAFYHHAFGYTQNGRMSKNEVPLLRSNG